MKNLTFVIGLVLMLIWGCSKMPVYKSTWQQPSFQLDGSEEDWKGKMYYDSESGFMYGLSNDNKKLFVKLKISNQLIQRKVLAAGLTFWMDTVGKKKKQLGITFPIKSKPGGMAGGGSQRIRDMKDGQGLQQHMDIANFNSKYKSGMEGMMLINFFGNKRNDMIDNINDEGINAMLHFDEDQTLFYEAEISLDKIFSNPTDYLEDTTKYFSFGFETGKLEMPSGSNGGGRPQMGGGGQMEGGGRMGIGPSGMGPSGRGRGGQMNDEHRAEMEAMAKQSKVWVKKASLANSNNE